MEATLRSLGRCATLVQLERTPMEAAWRTLERRATLVRLESTRLLVCAALVQLVERTALIRH